MAFKLDFNALISPRSQAEIDAEYGEQRQRLQTLIDTRKGMIAAVVGQVTLTEWERQFVAGLQFKATTYDVGGIFAGGLATLSDKQMEALCRLYQKYEEANFEGTLGANESEAPSPEM